MHPAHPISLFAMCFRWRTCRAGEESRHLREKRQQRLNSSLSLGCKAHGNELVFSEQLPDFLYVRLLLAIRKSLRIYRHAVPSLVFVSSGKKRTATTVSNVRRRFNAFTGSFLLANGTLHSSEISNRCNRAMRNQVSVQDALGSSKTSAPPRFRYGSYRYVRNWSCASSHLIASASKSSKRLVSYALCCQ